MTIEEYLEGRGMSPIIRSQFRLKIERGRILVPIIDIKLDKIGLRSKALKKDNTPKMFWVYGQKATKDIFYNMSAFKGNHKNEIWIVNGEPSVWAMVTGHVCNVVSYTSGENGPPETFGEIFKSHDIKRIYYCPDNDLTGMKAAAKTKALCLKNSLHFEAYSLVEAWTKLWANQPDTPQKAPRGADIGDLLYAFARGEDGIIERDLTIKVIEVLRTCRLEIPDEKPEETTGDYSSSHLDEKEFNPALVAAVESKLEAMGGKLRGNRRGIKSPADHVKDDPGEHAHYYYDSKLAYDFARGETFLLKDLAEWLGIDIKEMGGLYKKRPAETRRRQKQRAKPAFTEGELERFRDGHIPSGQMPLPQTLKEKPGLKKRPLGQLPLRPAPTTPEPDSKPSAPLGITKKKPRWDHIPRTELPRSPGTPQLPDSFEPFADVVRGNYRYITDMVKEMDIDLNRRVIAIKSDLGTGKTQLINQMTIANMRKGRTHLNITHRIALSKNLEARAKEMQIRAINYGDVTYWNHTRDYLIITPNSIYKLNHAGGMVANITDVVIIDEISQVRQHLIGGTLRNEESISVYQNIKLRLQKAKQVIVADANLKPHDLKWLEQIIGEKPLLIENTHVTKRGIMYQAEKINVLITDIVKRALSINRKYPILVATEFRSVAKSLGGIEGCDEIEAIEGLLESFGLDVLAIHGGNSHRDEIREKIANINETLTEYDVIIYTSSMGTGVDITHPVDSVYGIFQNQTLTLDDQFQMLARARNCNRYVVFSGEIDRDLETSPNMIYGTELRTNIQSLYRNKQVFDLNPDGTPKYPEIVIEFAHFSSDIKADQNKQRIDQDIQFWRSIQKRGFRSLKVLDRKRVMRGIRKRSAIHEKIKQLEMTLALTVQDRIDEYEYRALKNKGTSNIKDDAAHEAWKLEEFFGLPVSEFIYENKNMKEKVRFLEINLKGSEYRRNLDALEHSNRVPVSRRTNAVRVHNLWNRLMRILGFMDERGQIIRVRQKKDDFLARLALFNEIYEEESADRVFKRRRDVSVKALSRAHFIVNIAFRLEYIQTTEGGVAVQFYELAEEDVSLCFQLLAARLRAFDPKNEKLAEYCEKNCLQPVDLSPQKPAAPKTPNSSVNYENPSKSLKRKTTDSDKEKERPPTNPRPTVPLAGETSRRPVNSSLGNHNPSSPITLVATDPAPPDRLNKPTGPTHTGNAPRGKNPLAAQGSAETINHQETLFVGSGVGEEFARTTVLSVHKDVRENSPLATNAGDFDSEGEMFFASSGVGGEFHRSTILPVDKDARWNSSLATDSLSYDSLSPEEKPTPDLLLDTNDQSLLMSKRFDDGGGSLVFGGPESGVESGISLPAPLGRPESGVEFSSRLAASQGQAESDGEAGVSLVASLGRPESGVEPGISLAASPGRPESEVEFSSRLVVSLGEAESDGGAGASLPAPLGRPESGVEPGISLATSPGRPESDGEAGVNLIAQADNSEFEGGPSLPNLMLHLNNNADDQANSLSGDGLVLSDPESSAEAGINLVASLGRPESGEASSSDVLSPSSSDDGGEASSPLVASPAESVSRGDASSYVLFHPPSIQLGGEASSPLVASPAESVSPEPAASGQGGFNGGTEPSQPLPPGWSEARRAVPLRLSRGKVVGDAAESVAVPSGLNVGEAGSDAARSVAVPSRQDVAARSAAAPLEVPPPAPSGETQSGDDSTSIIQANITAWSGPWPSLGNIYWKFPMNLSDIGEMVVLQTELGDLPPYRCLLVFGSSKTVFVGISSTRPEGWDDGLQLSPESLNAWIESGLKILDIGAIIS